MLQWTWILWLFGICYFPNKPSGVERGKIFQLVNFDTFVAFHRSHCGLHGPFSRLNLAEGTGRGGFWQIFSLCNIIFIQNCTFHAYMWLPTIGCCLEQPTRENLNTFLDSLVSYLWEVWSFWATFIPVDLVLNCRLCCCTILQQGWFWKVGVLAEWRIGGCLWQIQPRLIYAPADLPPGHILTGLIYLRMLVYATWAYIKRSDKWDFLGNANTSIL